MEGKQELNSGLPVKSDEVSVSESYLVNSRNENISQSSGPTVAAVAAPPTSMAAPAMVLMKKKRGRPRKYRPDGTATVATLSPMPISASIPLSGDFSGGKVSRGRGRGRVRRHFQGVTESRTFEYLNQGDQLAYMVSGNLSPHVITVNTGEDIAMKIHSFSLQEPQAICVLCASGSVSNVTIRQPDSCGGTMTYEGCFEILSLSGSFLPSDNGFMKSRSGGISVTLASSNGRVFGGGLAGLLVAASPVQVVIGSFLSGKQHVAGRIETMLPLAPDINPPIIREVSGAGNGGQKTTSFHHNTDNSNYASNNDDDNMGSLNPMIDISELSPDGESNDNSPSKYESSG